MAGLKHRKHFQFFIQVKTRILYNSDISSLKEKNVRSGLVVKYKFNLLSGKGLNLVACIFFYLQKKKITGVKLAIQKSDSFMVEIHVDFI